MRRIVLGVLAVVGCGQAQADEVAQADTTTEDAARALATREAMQEAEAEAARLRETGTPAGEPCRVACATSYAMLCYRVTTLCTTATVVTVGGSVIPCATATLVACPGGVALATLCAGQCPP